MESKSKRWKAKASLSAGPNSHKADLNSHKKSTLQSQHAGSGSKACWQTEGKAPDPIEELEQMCRSGLKVSWPRGEVANGSHASQSSSHVAAGEGAIVERRAALGAATSTGSASVAAESVDDEVAAIADLIELARSGVVVRWPCS